MQALKEELTTDSLWFYVWRKLKVGFALSLSEDVEKGTRARERETTNIWERMEHDMQRVLRGGWRAHDAV